MENRENYKIVSSLLEKLLFGLKQKTFSLLDIYAENNYLLSDLRSSLGDSLKEVVLVTNNDLDIEENTRRINVHAWENNIESWSEKLKNSVVLYNKYPFSIESFERDMKIFSSSFPVVIVLSNDKKWEDLENWALKNYDDVHVFINKSAKKFKTFRIANFDDLESPKLASLSSDGDYVITEREGDEFDLVLEKPPEGVVTKLKPDDFNWDLFKNLPYPTLSPDPENPKWMQEFYTYLKELLSRILPPGKEKLLPHLLNKTTLKTVWVRTFTSKNLVPIIEQNYEMFEKLGDGLQKHAFFIYLIKDRFPNAEPSTITNIIKEILKKEFQSVIGQHMGLHKWAIVPEQFRGNIELQEDLFEAFTGAIDYILNNKSDNVGQATTIIYYLFKNIFNDYSFTKQLALDSKTWVNQLVISISTHKGKTKDKSFYLAKPNEIDSETWEEFIEYGNNLLRERDVEGLMTSQKIAEKNKSGFDEITNKTEDGMLEKKIVLNDFGAMVLRNKGIKVKEGDVFGYAIQATERHAKNVAFDKAKEKLESLGVTENWRIMQKAEKSISNLDNIDRVLSKAKKKYPKISYVLVEQGKTLKKHAFYYILGYDKDGKKYVIHTYTSDDRNKNNFQAIVDDYLDN